MVSLVTLARLAPDPAVCRGGRVRILLVAFLAFESSLVFTLFSLLDDDGFCGCACVKKGRQTARPLLLC